MFAEILIAMVLGIVFGIFTGLFPGIHINLVSIFVVSLFGLFVGLNGIILAVFIVAMGITHTFIDIIPAVFFYGSLNSSTYRF